MRFAAVTTAACWIILGAGLSEPASAALQPRLGGAAVYDTDLNITWLTNANLAATNMFGTGGIGADGKMSWNAAQNWISSMNLAKYLGFSTWRLPATPASDPSCSGLFSCTGSEMGHLFYVELAGQAGVSIAAQHNSNYSLFTNFSDVRYWSGTNPADFSGAAAFLFSNGSQAAAPKTDSYAALAVLTGDIAASHILPQFAWGGGWYSALYFTNTGNAPQSFPVNLIADTGTPLSFPSVGLPSILVSIAAGGTAIIEAPNTGTLNQGYVLMTLPPGVTGYGVFRQSVPGITDQEAVVPLSGALSTTSTLIFDDTNFTTSVAIVNPSAVATTVTITLKSTSGLIMATANVTLSAKTKVPVALRNVPGLLPIIGNRGSATFTVTTGNVAVLGLRFAGAAFTSIPTADK